MKKIVFILITFFLFLDKTYAMNATLNKCVDGDTAWFNVNGEVIKTRFLAIDTPESTTKIEEYGKEASEYTCNMLTNAKKIEIEYDDNSDKLDKYNRHLVWVFVDNTLLQKSLIENGLAEVAYLYGDYKYTSILEDSEELAKEKKLNIWSNSETSLDTNEVNYEKYLSILVVIAILILYIFNNKCRTKINKKFKTKASKKLNKEINNLFK